MADLGGPRDDRERERDRDDRRERDRDDRGRERDREERDRERERERDRERGRDRERDRDREGRDREERDRERGRRRRDVWDEEDWVGEQRGDDRELRRILREQVGRCIQFDLVSGRTITGFVREVNDDVVRLSAAGRTVWIVINNIEAFRQTTGQAC